ncbi:hypothetical protein ZEAMMB73_Zm00001d052740 [Zea mays]|jgi:hypothetical protein|uniref:Uncharacterized protein n=1 Tax=Zea mays TaxID=4577 RepID=K7U7J5_MAIZE|nr:hypothetical protein ZEAMMB73_Zm00001d052740 [Zea mays]
MAVLASAAPVLACSVLRTPPARQRRVGGAPLLRAPGERARRLGLLRPAAPAQLRLRSAAAGWHLRAWRTGGGGRASLAEWRWRPGAGGPRASVQRASLERCRGGQVSRGRQRQGAAAGAGATARSRNDGPLLGRACQPGLQPTQPQVEIRPYLPPS